MGLPLPAPQLQFIDGDGNPYAGGTVETYVPGTTTPQNTWADEGETVLNTNPVVLDAAGRASIWGSGDCRFIVRDVTGQLVYDGVTSVANLAGLVTTAQLNAAVQTETNRAEAAESTLTNNLTAETTRAEAAESTLTTNLNNEITRAEAAEAHLQSQITTAGTQSIQFGYATTNTSGVGTVTFTTAYTSAPEVVVTQGGTGFTDVWIVTSSTTTGFTATASQPGSSYGTVTGVACGFSWISIGV